MISVNLLKNNNICVYTYKTFSSFVNEALDEITTELNIDFLDYYGYEIVIKYKEININLRPHDMVQIRTRLITELLS